MFVYSPTLTFLCLLVTLGLQDGLSLSSEESPLTPTNDSVASEGTKLARSKELTRRVEKTPPWIADWEARYSTISNILDRFYRNLILEMSFARNSRGSLRRMPAGFGKRDNNQQLNPSSGHVNLNTVEEQLKSENIGMDAILQGQLAAGGQNRVSQKNTDRTLEDVYEHASHDRGRDIDFFNRERRGKLGRMPMAFGKRREELEFNQNEDDSFVKKTLWGDRLTINEDQENTKVLHSERNMENEMDNNMETRGQLSGGTMEKYSTRVRRSRLFRMPVAFGKRDKAYRILDDAQNNFDFVGKTHQTDGGDFIRPNDYRRVNAGERGYDHNTGAIRNKMGFILHLGKFPTTVDNRWSEDKRNIRRMPLSFGKRQQSNSESTLKLLSSIYPQKTHLLSWFVPRKIITQGDLQANLPVQSLDCDFQKCSLTPRPAKRAWFPYFSRHIFPKTDMKILPNRRFNERLTDASPELKLPHITKSDLEMNRQVISPRLEASLWELPEPDVPGTYTGGDLDAEDKLHVEKMEHNDIPFSDVATGGSYY